MSEDNFDKDDEYVNDYLEAQSEPSTVGDEMPPSLEVAEKPLFVPEQPKVNFECVRKAAGEPTPNQPPIMSFIRESYRNVSKLLERSGNLLEAMHSGELMTTGHDDIWMANLFAGLNNISLDETPLGATERESSYWKQGISYPNQEQLMRPGRPRQGYDKSKKNTKDSALAYLSYRSGMGGNYETFLPHSGIWVRLRRPSLGEVVAMQTELQSLRVRLGNDTKGLAFSHVSFRQLDAITDLAMGCVVGSNRQYSTPSDLEEHMSIFDEAILHHALAAVMYPDGFNYAVPCVADPDNCNGVVEFKMNMSNIVFYDDTIFTPEQRKFIGKRFTPATDDEFKAYREAFTIGNSRIVWQEDVGVKIAPPSVAKRRVSAKLWYDTLIDMTKGAFNESPDNGKRYEYLRRLQQATKATQYSHWVEAIYLKDPDATSLEDQLFTDDQEIIMEYISATVSEREFFDNFVKEVEGFSNESIIGMCALPSHNCPLCKSPQGQAYIERLPHLIPIDMLATFFTLADLRVK